MLPLSLYLFLSRVCMCIYIYTHALICLVVYLHQCFCVWKASLVSVHLFCEYGLCFLWGCVCAVEISRNSGLGSRLTSNASSSASHHSAQLPYFLLPELAVAALSSPGAQNQCHWQLYGITGGLWETHESCERHRCRALWWIPRP